MLALNEVQVPAIAERWGAHVPVIVIGHLVDTAFYRPAPMPESGYVLAIGDDEGRDYPTLLAALPGLQTPVRIRTSLLLGPVAAPAIWMRDRLSGTGLRDLYADASFVVVPLHPDTRNASGVSAILESGAMGRAVIVSDSDGVREFVRHGETGLVVPAHDPAALRGAIYRLLADPAEAIGWGWADGPGWSGSPRPRFSRRAWPRPIVPLPKAGTRHTPENDVLSFL